MRHRELFALGVRLFGVWLITRSVFYVEGFADVKLYPLRIEHLTVPRAT